MNEITVKLDNRELIVKKLPLGKYAELLGAIKQLPKHIQNLGAFDNPTIIAQLPQLIAGATPDFMAIISIATDLKKEEVEALGLNEAVKILIAIIEVNKYKEVYQDLKKALAQPVTQKVTK